MKGAIIMAMFGLPSPGGIRHAKLSPEPICDMSICWPKAGAAVRRNVRRKTIYPLKPYPVQFSISKGPCPAEVCIAPLLDMPRRAMGPPHLS